MKVVFTKNVNLVLMQTMVFLTTAMNLVMRVAVIVLTLEIVLISVTGYRMISNQNWL